MTDYPYFIYPRICRLRQTSDPDTIAELNKFIAANVGVREALAPIIGSPEADLAGFYPQERPSRSRADETIDSFIAKFGVTASEPLILSEPSEETGKPEEPEEATITEAKPEDDENGEITLQKVKLLVKNHNYEEALAIMEEFYLNNPKKSVYFADQIRFVKIMMLNDRKK